MLHVSHAPDEGPAWYQKSLCGRRWHHVATRLEIETFPWCKSCRAALEERGLSHSESGAVATLTSLATGSTRIDPPATSIVKYPSRNLTASASITS